VTGTRITTSRSPPGVYRRTSPPPPHRHPHPTVGVERDPVRPPRVTAEIDEQPTVPQRRPRPVDPVIVIQPSPPGVDREQPLTIGRPGQPVARHQPVDHHRHLARRRIDVQENGFRLATKRIGPHPQRTIAVNAPVVKASVDAVGGHTAYLPQVYAVRNGDRVHLGDHAAPRHAREGQAHLVGEHSALAAAGVRPPRVDCPTANVDPAERAVARVPAGAFAEGA
jgi:hypothetical protein